MAINPVNVPRVSFNLRTQTLIAQLQANNLSLFNVQQQISTGHKLLNPSDDPIAAGRIVRSNDLLARQDQILSNLQHADRFLTASEAAVHNIADLLIQAKSIASEQISSLQSADQRASAAILIDGLIDQLQTIGNQQYTGRYLFGGTRTDQPPLDSSLGRVTFTGDSNSRSSQVDFGVELPFNLTADRLFGLADNPIKGFADLNPAIAATTRLTDLRGNGGFGIRGGTFHVVQTGGSGGSFDIDLTGVDTAGDLIAKFNAAATAAGSTLTLSLTANGFQVNGGAGIQIDVTEVGGAHAASDLGLLGGSALGAPLTGVDVDPKVTATTPLSALNGGAGLTLPDGVQVTSGGTTTTITFAGATTVQDVLNRLSNSGVGIRASLNAAGTGIDVLNQVSGTALSIGENGGSDATKLGIRTLYAGTTLASLNQGRGVTRVAGADLHIIDANNIAFDLDLDGANTLQDVITAINTAAGTAGSTLTASLRTTGNGLHFSHPAAGAQNIVVQRANLSSAADDLGILKTGDTQNLDGDDVNPIRPSGAFSALYRLADALRANNTQEITAAGGEIDAAIKLVANQQGLLGARSASVQERLNRTEDAVLATKRFVSELQDVDLTEAITQFQQAQLALQANLKTGSTLLNLSLLDFLA